MAASEAQKRATKKFNDTHYDDLHLRVPKGYGAIYRAFAKNHDISLSKLFVRLMEQEISRYNSHDELDL